MSNPYISGTGYYLPPRVVTNEELSNFMDTSNEWILERTGIEERRYVESGVGPSDLAIPATEQALLAAGLTVKDIDFIIFATSTPDYYAPGSGCLLQEKMGFGEIGALDVRVQCSGFVYGLSIAEQYIRTGMFKHILLIGAEVQSTAMDLTTEGRDTAVIFGDGAGAAIISATEEDRGILSTHLHTDGRYVKELWLEAPASKAGHPRISKNDLDEGKQYLKMNGREVFRHAVTRFPEVIIEALKKNKIEQKDIGLLIPHQANLRITQMIQKKMGLRDDQVMSNIHKYGNTTAGTIPIALGEAIEEGRISEGDIVVFASFGSGFSWASAVMKW
ncbi:MAG: beta-ketoacyl-ACP synthase III [Candidatus Marinimicrobia bacterium]|jgi:3-oxoacyl-[acyl-carrier-protein] synthase-3|nr:beta-ketoacyl-ACP synthase III [Candidatus Neomarinimicrobiota bacterium]MDP6852983.1 beta-ketoacyl-ACP synthase III [Candidatus Neomarinimicrobiota bacterium]MDP6936636.1 beta-ketoacyl-ACP synthase III [Candidatus Neomarinimicrobiota bacterium]